MKKLILALAVSVYLPTSTIAMGFGSSSSSDSTPQMTYDMGYEKAMDGDYAGAIDVLKSVVDDDPNNADAWNMLGYSYRNNGDADNAWDAYEHALAIDPNHKGAHEYIGEWYLMQGDMASANAQRAKLETLCPSGCEELDALNDAIQQAMSNS